MRTGEILLDFLVKEVVDKLSFLPFSQMKASNMSRKAVQWQHSWPRAILVLDLEEEVLPIDTSAEDAWEIYRTFAEFANIPFDVFQAKLPDLQAETQQKFIISFIEEQALVHDRNLHPRAMHNHRGEPVFDLVADAKRLLREDVKNGVHNSMTPSQMQRTRPEYHQFEAVIFKFRIYQEIRRQKFVHYLQLKRDAKLGPG